jgi:hypothetical protein
MLVYVMSLRPPRSRTATQVGSVPMTDPATFTGDHAEQLARVIEVRDAIEARLRAWIQTLPSTTGDRR